MGIKEIKLRACFACLFVVAAVVCVWAQRRIEVPKDFSTIQRALGETVEGDTVFVRKGVYKENITLVDDVVLMGEDAKGTVIDGRGRGPVVTGADGAVITGFTIRNGTTGILCKNTRPVIMNNIIIDNKGTGIHALVSLPDIVNNVIYRNAWTGIFLESVRGTRTSINHNVIMENGYGGIFGAGRTEVLIRNNILMGNKQYGVFLGPESRRTRIVGNNIYANRLPYNENADNQAVRQQNISVDPQLSSPGFPFHNYTVKSGSPNKGRGEEGADIGLSESMKLSVKPMERERAGDLESYFTQPQEEAAGETFAAAAAPPQDSWMPPVAPAPVVEAPMAITEAVILHGVSFPEGGTDLLPESFPVLDMILASLAYYADLRIEIAGHTHDGLGDEDASKSLSHRRAGAVRDYFVSRGIDRSRLVARGYGMERPIASNETPEGRANNMRIEVVPLR